MFKHILLPTDGSSFIVLRATCVGHDAIYLYFPTTWTENPPRD